MSWKIVLFAFISLCYPSQSIELTNNATDCCVVIGEFTNTKPRTVYVPHQSSQIHTVSGSHVWMKSIYLEKIKAFGDILTNGRNHFGYTNKNVVRPNDTLVWNNLAMKDQRPNANSEILHISNDTGTIIHRNKILMNQDIAGNRVNRETVTDNEMQQEINKSHEMKKQNIVTRKETQEEGDTGEEERNNEQEESKTKVSAFNTEDMSSSVSTDTAMKKNAHVVTEIRELDGPKDLRNKTSPFTTDRNEVNKFIQKLDHILSSSGDYIIALILRVYKHRLRTNHMNQKFWTKVQQMAKKSNSNWDATKNQLQKKIKSEFGESFIAEVANSLKILANDVELSS